MSDQPGRAPKPWYREGWLWFVLTPPMCSIVVGLGLVFAAVTYGDSEVVDDRIDVGRATHKLHERERIAEEVGAAAELRVSESGVEVVWDGDEAARPETLRLLLTHPTRADADRVVYLKASDDGFRPVDGDTEAGTPLGRRYVQIEPEDGRWRLVGELEADAGSLSLRPRPPVFASSPSP